MTKQQLKKQKALLFNIEYENKILNQKNRILEHQQKLLLPRESYNDLSPVIAILGRSRVY